MDLRLSRILPLAAAAALAAACASPAPVVRCPAPAESAPVTAACFPGTPCFRADGSVRRDAATGAPVYEVRSVETAALAPRFHADGTVARDPETGAPLYEEKSSGGRVVRVFLVLP